MEGGEERQAGGSLQPGQSGWKRYTKKRDYNSQTFTEIYVPAFFFYFYFFWSTFPVIYFIHLDCWKEKPFFRDPAEFLEQALDVLLHTWLLP